MSFLVCGFVFVVIFRRTPVEVFWLLQGRQKSGCKEILRRLQTCSYSSNNRFIVANLSTRPLFSFSGCKCKNEPRAAGTGQPVDIRKLLTLVFNVTKGKFWRRKKHKRNLPRWKRLFQMERPSFSLQIGTAKNNKLYPQFGWKYKQVGPWSIDFPVNSSEISRAQEKEVIFPVLWELNNTFLLSSFGR